MPICALALAVVLCARPAEHLPGREIAAAHSHAADPRLRAVRMGISTAADGYWRAIEAGRDAAAERAALDRAWNVRHLGGRLIAGHGSLRPGLISHAE